MKVMKTNSGYIVRLIQGEELIAALLDFVEIHKITGGFFHGLGGASSATLGIYRIDSDKQYHFTDFNGPLEILSLNGNIAISESGEAMIHCHGVISGIDLLASGGHVKQLTISGTCEIIINVTLSDLRRQIDMDTGLNLLDINE